MKLVAPLVVCGLLLAGAASAQPAPPPLPPTTRLVEESCDDEVKNGPESDVDCGGDCPPCERKAACSGAADCLSGLCVSGECQERRLVPGEPIPEGYETALARKDAAASVRLVGGLFFGVGYGSAYFAALSYPGRIGGLYVPVFGPWATLKQVDHSAGKVLLAADGALQGAGAILLIGGIARAGQRLVKKPREETPETGFDVHVVPHWSRGGVGLSVGACF